MGEKRQEAIDILKNMLSPELSAQIESGADATFAPRLNDLALDNVFEPLWTDQSLDLRTRSLVTLSMLIALRAEEEMHVHFPAAIRNGATLQDLEQLIYQASAYVGFPGANTARNIARASLREAGLL